MPEILTHTGYDIDQQGHKQKKVHQKPPRDTSTGYLLGAEPMAQEQLDLELLDTSTTKAPTRISTPQKRHISIGGQQPEND